MRSERAGVRVLRAVAAASLAVALIAAPVMLLVYVPAYTRALVPAVRGPELAGLPEPVALQAAEDVRRVVAGGDEARLPDRVGRREGFGVTERSHLADVREVVAFGRGAGIGAGMLFALSVLLLDALGVSRPMRGAARGAGFGLLGFIALAGITGAADFDWLFERFHGLFFAAGTWTFPYSSLLIQLFPTAFWAVSGAVWAGACALSAAVLLVFGGRHRNEEV